MHRLTKILVLGIALSVLLTGSMAFAGGKGNGRRGQAVKGSPAGIGAQGQWSGGMPPGSDQGQKKGWTDTGVRGWGKGHKKGWGEGNAYPKGIGKKQP
jgi:hypothetical protein